MTEKNCFDSPAAAAPPGLILFLKKKKKFNLNLNTLAAKVAAILNFFHHFTGSSLLKFDFNHDSFFFTDYKDFFQTPVDQPGLLLLSKEREEHFSAWLEIWKEKFRSKMNFWSNFLIFFLNLTFLSTEVARNPGNVDGRFDFKAIKFFWLDTSEGKTFFLEVLSTFLCCRLLKKHFHS